MPGNNESLSPWFWQAFQFLLWKGEGEHRWISPQHFVSIIFMFFIIEIINVWVTENMSSIIHLSEQFVDFSILWKTKD